MLYKIYDYFEEEVEDWVWSEECETEVQENFTQRQISKIDNETVKLLEDSKFNLIKVKDDNFKFEYLLDLSEEELGRVILLLLTQNISVEIRIEKINNIKYRYIFITE